MRLKYFLILLISFLFAACTTVPAPKPEIEPNYGPVLKGFTINDREVVSGYGPIISHSGNLILIAKASAGNNLSSISIERKKHAENNVLLTTCISSPCQYDWDVSKADDGVYSFFVTIVDTEGITLKVPFKDSLSIDIENIEPTSEAVFLNY